LGYGIHTLVEILLQLGTGLGAGFGCSMEFLGLLQHLLGPLVKLTDGDLFCLKHLLHRIKVLPLLHSLLLLGFGPHLEQGAPFLEAQLLRL
jgi:hypothetical protein